MRLVPEIPFPPYTFIPGVNPHPKKEGGYREGIPEPEAGAVDPQNPLANEFLKHAVDLYNHGYFWESHVYFEALWNAHNRIGSVADLFKAMIKLGAAGVKTSLGQKENAEAHFARAKELFKIVNDLEGETFLGFDLKQILTDVDQQKFPTITFLSSL